VRAPVLDPTRLGWCGDKPTYQNGNFLGTFQRETAVSSDRISRCVRFPLRVARALAFEPEAQDAIDTEVEGAEHVMHSA